VSALPKLARVAYLRAWEQASPDGLYRWLLGRQWAPTPTPFVVYVMLNPSKAAGVDAAGKAIDDPTVRKCVGFARRAGFGGLMIVNLFAWRSTDPAELGRSIDPVGAENDTWIRDACCSDSTTRVIAAWGSNARVSSWARERERKVLELLRWAAPELYALRLGVDRVPLHPLMLPYDLQPVVLRPRVAR
jgi:hypothetical protein